MKTLLLIDGNAIMHRAYHALPPFKAADGTPTNVVYGYLSMLNKVVTDFKPDYLISCFDTPKATFRNKLFKEYQSQRPKIDDDFIIQIPLVKQAVDAAGIERMEKEKIFHYAIVMDPLKIGYPIYDALYLNLVNFTKEQEKKLEFYTKKNKNIIYSAKTMGKYDYIIGFVAMNTRELNDLISEFKTEFQNIIPLHLQPPINK